VVIDGRQEDASTTAARELQSKGVEVVGVATNDGSGPAITSRVVTQYMYDKGLLSAFWMVGDGRAKEAVHSGSIQEMSVYVGLDDADQLDDISSKFGRNLKVSVMTCDALGSHACLLNVLVDDDDDGDSEAANTS